MAVSALHGPAWTLCRPRAGVVQLDLALEDRSAWQHAQPPMMRVRAATVTDAEPLARLSTQLGYPVDAATIGRRLQAITASPTGELLVAVAADGRVVGLAHALSQQFVTEDPFVELVALVIDENARSAGTGAALLAAVEAWARAQGVVWVRVHSNVVRQRAHRFYLRAGYQEEKRQVVFVKHL